MGEGHPGTGGVEDLEHFGGFVEQRVLPASAACDPTHLLRR